MTFEAVAQEGGHAKRTPLSTVVNKGLPERRALSPSAPVVLLTMRTGAVSPVSSDSSMRGVNPVLTFLSTVVYGYAPGGF